MDIVNAITARKRVPVFDAPAAEFNAFRGFPGWINLIGIESPGLTASLAIGEYVRGLIK